MPTPHLDQQCTSSLLSLTISTSHILSSCSTACPLFPLHFPHAKFFGNFAVYPFYSNHTIHPYHGSTWLNVHTKLCWALHSSCRYHMGRHCFSDATTVHHFGFPGVNLQDLALKSLFHFMNSFLYLRLSDLSGLNHQHTEVHLIHLICQFCDSIYHKCKKKM